MAQTKIDEKITRRIKLESENLKGVVTTKGMITISEKQHADWATNFWNSCEIHPDDVDEFIDYLTTAKSAAKKVGQE